MDPTVALARLSSARVGVLTTVRPSGSPHVIPVVFAVDGREVFTAVDHKPKRTNRLQRLANIQSDPRASLLAQHYSEDWRELWWTRVDGWAELVEDGPRFERAIDALIAKYEQYQAQPPSGPVIAIGVENVVGWASTGAG